MGVPILGLGFGCRGPFKGIPIMRIVVLRTALGSYFWKLECVGSIILSRIRGTKHLSICISACIEES